jgi:hypothetical protein
MRQRLELPLRQNICVMNQARQLDLVHLIHLSRRPPNGSGQCRSGTLLRQKCLLHDSLRQLI